MLYRGESLSDDHRVTPADSSAPPRPFHTSRAVDKVPRWGYVSHAVGRYGASYSRLVVYPPNADERTRRFAEACRLFVPIAAGGGLVVGLLLAGVGAPLGASALLIAGVLLPVGGYLALRSAPVRRCSVMLWSSCFAFHPDARDAEREEGLLLFSRVLEGASRSLRRGEMSSASFYRVWQAIYDEVAEMNASRIE